MRSRLKSSLGSQEESRTGPAFEAEEGEEDGGKGFVLAVVHEGIVLHARLAASKPRRLHGMEEKEGRGEPNEGKRERTDGSGTHCGSVRRGAARPQANRGANRGARGTGNVAENRLAIALNRRSTMIPPAVARGTSELLVDE